MTTTDIEVLTGYQAALQTSAYYHQAEIGCLRISGPDRADFLQRQSTNDLKRLAPGGILTTVLTDPAARILDVLTLYEEDETFTTVTLPRSASETAAFLRSRIFFKDQVSVSDASQEYTHFLLIGPQVEHTLKRLGASPIPDDRAILHLEIDSAPVSMFKRWDWGYQLTTSMEACDKIERGLEAAGAARLSEASFTARRVESGIPAGRHELTGEYTPLETGLRALISDSKGCYTGQEVVARQITYHKVTRQLAGLRLSALVEPGSRLWSPDLEQPAGEATSVVDSPRFGPIALGIVRRSFIETGTRLRLSRNENGETAEVVSLPFRD